MKTKTFGVVTSLAMAITLIAAALSIIGIIRTGLYPAIIILCLLGLVPIASRHYAKKMANRPNAFQRNYYITGTLINLLSILVVLWMSFVIVHDRVLQDCC